MRPSRRIELLGPLRPPPIVGGALGGLAYRLLIEAETVARVAPAAVSGAR